MFRKLAPGLAAVVLAMTAASPASAAVLIVNGGFEDATGFVGDGVGGMGLGVGATTLTGWTVITDAITWFGANPYGLTGSGGSTRFLDLSGYTEGAPFGGVTQTVATSIGAEYRLTFDLGSHFMYGIPAKIRATVGGVAQTFTSSVIAGNAWETQTFDFTATSTSTVIDFLAVGGLNYIGLDNVALVRTSPEPPPPLGGGIPEPAVWAMLIMGFWAVGAAVRTQRRLPPRRH